jgi:ATP-dependent 26S proteasome regulatory subunit
MFKNRKYKHSATTIHQYNQFLANLDKNKQKEDIQKKGTSITTTSKDDDTLDQVIKNLQSLFELNYDNTNFHGLSKNEMNEIYDPNLFENSIATPHLKNSKKSIIITPTSNKSKMNTETKEKKKITIDVEITKIDDLLNLIDTYPYDETVEYNINMKSLHQIKESLIELNNMIGMTKLKNNIVDQILYFIQGLHTNNYKQADFMHTVLYGPPGTGKTEIAKIIGKIFAKMGILKNGVFKKVTRSDLIAGYLGQTALKTRDVIKECIGGVLFIDEAYALGNNEKRDSYSKECIDTLCEALSDHKHDLMVIIAGYEKELNECFFEYNQGLDSRFTWRFKTDKFEPEELFQVFLKKVKENGWTVDPEEKTICVDWFRKKMDAFPSYGRDMESLFSKIKIAHSRRVFCKPETEKKKISGKDLEKGYEIYLQNDNIQSKKEKEEFQKRVASSMYV